MQGRLHSLAAVMLFAVTGTAAVSYAHAADAGGALCGPDLRLDKESLAAYLIKAYPVSTAYLAMGADPAPLSSHRALASWLFKKRAAEKVGGGACSGDSCNVDRMAADLQHLLDGKEAGFRPSGPADAASFFGADNGAALSCSQAGSATALPHIEAAAPVAAAPQPGWMDPIRVRGNPDQLSIDRNNKAGYASVERAHVNLANDDVAQSRTNDVVVYAGYAFDKRPLKEAGSTYEAVPYVGFKQNRVTLYDSDGTPSVTTTRTSQVGMLSAFHFTHAGSADTEDLTARPDYLVNNTDGSRLLTVNFTLTPVRPGILNDFIRWNNGLAFKPILVGQSRNGSYVNRGDPAVYDQHQDFIRLGAQAGFTLASSNPALPFDFTTTFTGLKALQGSRSIHYWKSVLTYNFNQNVGLSLDYSNGLLPDTADPERKWGVGISSKF